MFEITLDELTKVFVGTALVAVRLEIRTGIHPEGQALSLHYTSTLNRFFNMSIKRIRTVEVLCLR